MLPVSLWASMDLQRSMPKLYGIVLGVAICYAIVNNVRRPSAAWSVGLAMAWLGVAVTALALLGTDWGEPGPIRLPLEYSGIARLLTRMGGSLSVGFNPNEVGGALTLFVPFVISLLVLGLRHGGTAMGQGALRWDSGRLPRLARHRLMPTMLALGLLPMLVTLALTQSRAAWLGTGAGLLVIASFGPRWLRATVAIVVVAGCLALCWLGPGSVADWLLAVDSDRTIAPRFDIWLRAVHMMQDMPYTGVGLNMFSQTVNSLYPLLTVPPEKVLELTHAHNVLLQVAVDVGLLGLVAYLALLLGVGASWVYSWRHLASRPMRALTVGLLSSMVAYHVYGLADCLTLGAKPGVFIWAQWGLMATLANLSMSVESTAGAE
jgi:putative inorganic carbon (HCO3(-)) transporter